MNVLDTALIIYFGIKVCNKTLEFSYANCTMAQELPTSESSFLPETTTTSPSQYTTSDVHKAEICLDMKFVTSHYLH